MTGPNERDEIAALPRCPGCGSVIDPKRHTCHPLTVDATQPGYRYLEGIWGYCLTLSRDVRIGEDWLAERDRRTAAKAVREAADWMNSAEFKQPEASRYINESHWNDAIVDACDALELRARQIEADQ